MGKWANTFDLGEEMCQKIFRLPFIITKNSKLQWFQTRINHRILGTNRSLFKMKITQSPLCSFCRETDETIEHLFWECDHVQSLLQSIDNYCMNILASSFNVKKQDFILGDVKGSNEDNLICIQIKYYIYTMRCLSKRLSVEGAIASIKSLAKTCQQIALEKGQIHILITSGEIGYLSFDQLIYSP